MLGWHSLGSNLISKSSRRFGQLQLRFPQIFPNEQLYPHSPGWTKSLRGLLQPGGDRQAGGTSPACSHVLVEKVQSPAGILPALGPQLSPQLQEVLSHIPGLF